MTNEELTRDRERGWNSFTKYSAVSVVIIMAILALMAATLV
ncbi:hypothetical protein [Kiloniella laminariae]|uniref:Cytochrome c oxidase subunit IV bacterial aa3 type domain-containing protein n=1 Tax=Kiloniella laminariae TaxID=454162 RepID=A0ABT4LGZ0_9PROT|nr:hypothetical protein [Kiloniella laminariae]MCZ4280371.1 hypothetical protein [Kiloniella laminariae]